jgi:hypothetical protein
MPLQTSPKLARQEIVAAAGTVLSTAAATTYGPFKMETYQGILIDLTRSDDGTNGTLALVVKSWSDALGALEDILDGAGNPVEMNGLAAGENVRRQVQIHPTAGPCPSDDADGVFKVGTTGIASNYYRQPMPPEFYIVVTPATDSSTVGISLSFLN